MLVGSAVFLLTGLFPQQAAACISTYIDYSVDLEEDELSAWGFIEDYFDEGSCYSQAYYQWYYWEHSYYADLQIETPAENVYYDYGSMDDVPYGGGYAQVGDFVCITCEGSGVFDLAFLLGIFCTIGGDFFSEPNNPRVPVAWLDCDPSVTRGGIATATLNATGATDQRWSFTQEGESAATVGPVPGGSSWGGVMVASGAISVTFDIDGLEDQEAEPCFITVNPREDFVTEAMAINEASEPPPGQILADLTTPPTLQEHLGSFGHDYLAAGGFQTYVTIPSGPNTGYTYFVDPPRADPYYRINEDLDFEDGTPPEMTSDFYRAQCGMNGYITGAVLLAQTRRHEYNHEVKSHLGFTNSRLALEDAAHNYGVYLEGRVSAPGNFENDSQTTLMTLAVINSTVVNENNSAHGTSSIPHVNYDENNNPIGNVNWGPLIQCIAG